jgi:putative NIF3 family GTP cyclohydrolase 1 type 2
MVARMERVCEEKVRAWRNSDRLVRRYGVVSGGGVLTEYVRDCVELGCDLYITGERSLYTLQYARHVGIHTIVGSHTFTEIQGVEALARRIGEAYGMEVVRVPEPHLESGHLLASMDSLI